MMEKRCLLRPLILISGFFSFLIAIGGCEKPEERMLGKDALPEGDRMKSKVEDSFRIETRTVSMPPVPASQSTPGMYGTLADERTGRTEATFFSQLLLPATNIDLGDPNDLTLDSAVLSLRYGGYYGDTSKVQEFRVHQVLEDMEGIDPSHRDSLDRSATPIGKEQIAPEPGQSVTLDGGSETQPPQLRIRLDDSFGRNILDRSGSSELSDDQAFTDFINGISVSSHVNSIQNREGAVLFAQIPNENTKLTLYYRNTASNDTSTLDLELGAAHFNRVEHNSDGSQMEPRLDSAFSSEQNRNYVVGPGETATELRFPTLRSLDDSTDVSINKAVLDLPVETSGGTVFPPTDGLFVLYRDASGELSLTKDRTEEGGEFIGGAYEAKEERYRLRITRHAQAILSGKVSPSIFVTTSIPFVSEDQANTVARSVLYGPGSSDPPRLEITYTEY